MSNNIRFEEIGLTDAVFNHIKTARQNWSTIPKWAGYKEKPRQDNGIVFIASDMTAKFCTADGLVVEAGKGDAVFVPKGTIYVTDFFNPDPNQGVHSYTINFKMYDSNGNELLDEGGLRIFARDYLGEFEPLAVELSLACNDLQTNQLRVMSKFYALLDGLMACTDERSHAYYPIRKGVEALCAEWDKNVRISNYAELCAISESYFHLLFKRWSGYSPVDYRNRLRISHAKAILQNTPMSIGEVSLAVGFEDRFYFSRVFKSVTGVSPQRYRKM